MIIFFLIRNFQKLLTQFGHIVVPVPDITYVHKSIKVPQVHREGGAKSTFLNFGNLLVMDFAETSPIECFHHVISCFAFEIFLEIFFFIPNLKKSLRKFGHIVVPLPHFT